MKQERRQDGRCNRVARLKKPDGLSEARDFSHGFFTMDIFNTDALIQMLEAVQAKGYKIAAAYILEKINTCNKNDDERFKKFDC